MLRICGGHPGNAPQATGLFTSAPRLVKSPGVRNGADQGADVRSAHAGYRTEFARFLTQLTSALHPRRSPVSVGVVGAWGEVCSDPTEVPRSSLRGRF